MNIVFLSNYLSHHQQPVCEELAKHTNYTFIATQDVPQERRSMGWENEKPDYLCCYRQEQSRAETCLRQADVVIMGSAPEALVRACIRRGQLVFRYSERPLKRGREWLKYLPRLVKWHWQNPTGKPIYLLCASAYTAGDYARFGLFRGRALRWGYFPERICYADITRLMAGKKRNILWAGNFLDWKHPDDAVYVAARLRSEGIDFDMTILGGGPMEGLLREQVRKEGLTDCVHLPGTVTPEEVRRFMECSRIYLFTSDRREGWGAVLNEAMNSGCAVVAGDAIGAVPYLLKDGENGCVYHSGDRDALYRRVKYLLEDGDNAERLGRAAYETILHTWNAETAARRLIDISKKLLVGDGDWTCYENGPCSPAELVREDWYTDETSQH